MSCAAILTLAGGVCRADIEAFTSARHDLDLGFTIGGKVIKVYVQPGERVEEGQVLLELLDEEGNALVKLYRLRATSDLKVKSAEEELKLARIEEEAIRKAYEKDAAKPIELDRAQIRTALADLAVALAKQEVEEAMFQLRQTMARHDQYVLRAPMAGVVDALEIAEGETVEPLKPVLRLVVTDPLQVDAAVPTDQTLNLKAGGPAWVQCSLPGFGKAIQGRIVHLAFVADAASNTRLVRIEVPNPDRLPAGSHVTVSFSPPAGVASAGVRADQGR